MVKINKHLVYIFSCVLIVLIFLMVINLVGYFKELDKTNAFDMVRTVFDFGSKSNSSKLISYWKNTYILTDSQFAIGYSLELSVRERVKFNMNKNNYYLGVLEIKDRSIKVMVGSENQTIMLENSRKVDLDKDGYFDIFYTLNSVNGFFKKADLTFVSLNEKSNFDSLALEKEKETLALNEFNNSRNRLSFSNLDWWIWIILIFVIILLLVVLIIYLSIKR